MQTPLYYAFEGGDRVITLKDLVVATVITSRHVAANKLKL
jgi:hypothetical protein